MNAPLSTDQHARRIKLYRALYEWKDYGGPMEDVLDAIGEYVIGVLNDQLARPAGDVPSAPKDCACHDTTEDGCCADYMRAGIRCRRSGVTRSGDA